MERYCRWTEAGYLSSTGSCFDVGGTVASALRRFRKTGNPWSGSEDPNSAGNGSIMRLAPVPLFFFPDLDAVEENAARSSRTTHAAVECVDACRLLGRILGRALLARTKDEVAYGDAGSFVGADQIVAIARGSYRGKPESLVRGTGYVVDSLEAAMWCFVTTDDFQSAILAAANLGEDADTTAAVCGQVAGAFYGASNVPGRWRRKLARNAEIAGLADRMWRRAGRRGRGGSPRRRGSR